MSRVGHSRIQARCDACSYKGEADWPDDKGAIRLDSGEIELLSYSPKQHLETLGYTREQVISEKRLVNVSRVVCCDCGQESQRYTARAISNCFAVFFLAILSCGGTFVLLHNWNSLIKPIVAWLVLALTMYLHEIGTRFLVRKQQKLLPPLHNCPHCASRKLRRVDSLRSRRIICPNCKQKTLKYHDADTE